ncbi:MAG: tRNA pseudouridine(13) synthase TruD [Gammaproteobacteria bacterium]|nr:tRNA pseudouridine(13) synthase TruD [Gammaproteobacteria bacterium]
MKTSLVYPYGKPAIKGRLKTTAEDFLVDEELGFEPTGEGEHLFILVEKNGLTTPELIEKVARDAGIKPRDIGYSGLKDKVAVTRQWLSLYLPGKIQSPISSVGDGYTILRQIWHNRKLRPGTHRFNRFEVLLRDVDQIDLKTHQQIESIKTSGMANYFGQQRFGVTSGNVWHALQVFSNARKTRKLSRSKKSLYLSALRSELFNQILSKRIEANIWQEPVQGDVFMLRGSQSVFQETLTEEMLSRYREFDISSTASLFGTGVDMLCEEALQIEKQVYSDNPDICNCLLEQGVKRQKRALRVVVNDFSYDYQAEEQQLRLTARLPRGSYFTSLLNHFVDTEA